MGGERWFYRDDAEWAAIAERLKLTPCPHCRAVGMLIRHGVLVGFDDGGPRRTIRARRVFCSNRHRRLGCGRTTSVWIANKIRRLSLTARTVWAFLQRTVAGSLAAAIRETGCDRRCDRTFRRVWQRFRRNQTAIRTVLLSRGPPPDLPIVSRWPAELQVLNHLHATFPHADCPIATFQSATRSFFV